MGVIGWVYWLGVVLWVVVSVMMIDWKREPPVVDNRLACVLSALIWPILLVAFFAVWFSDRVTRQ